MVASPSLTSVRYTPGLLVLFWNPDGGSAFSICISDPTGGKSSTYPATGSTTQIETTLSPPGDVWTVAIACTDGGTTGPYCAAIPIVTAAPTVTAVQNLLSSITASWSAQGDYSGGYVVTLEIQGQSAVSTTTQDLAITFPLQEPPSGDATTVSVQLKLMVGTVSTVGPATQYSVITALPAMTLVDYSNGQDLVLTWTAPAGYTAFKAFLQSSAGATTTALATTTTYSFPGPHTDATYTACVAATSPDAVSVGPASSVYTAITASPSLDSVINTGAGIALSWQALDGCSGYQAVLQVPDQPPTSATPTATGCTFPGPLSTPGSTCWVSGTAAGGVVLGPPSTVYIVLVGHPLWSLVAYDSDQMSLLWQASGEKEEVAGYLITVSGLSPSTYTVGNTTSSSISATLVPLTPYPTTVAAINGIVQGPSSPTLVPLTAPPLSAGLGYTGTALQLSWQASGEGNVSAYAVELLADGSSAETHSPTASSQTFTTTFSSGVVFTARVRSSGAGTLGPWSVSAVGPYQADIVYTYDALGRLETVAWGAGFTEAYSFDAAGNLLSATYSTTKG